MTFEILQDLELALLTQEQLMTYQSDIIEEISRLGDRDKLLRRSKVLIQSYCKHEPFTTSVFRGYATCRLCDSGLKKNEDSWERHEDHEPF